MNKSKKVNFQKVDPNPNMPEMEERLLKKWYGEGIVEKYLQKNDKEQKNFSFLDGPITANNPMGVHHAWGRTYKDLWQRYKNMRGFKQRFQNGFDAQGLWVEVEVEKELGFKSKKDIEEYGVDKFVQKCKDRVVKYSQIQTQQSKRLGYFMDWDNSYFTMSDENNYMIWKFIQICNDKGWLYKGADSVPWCPRCETAISQHEILTEDYKEVVHKSIFFELPIIGRDREFLLIWTTTPWTIPANIAVAVDESMDYSLVEGESGDKYWIAEGAVDRIFKGNAKVVSKVKGRKLVGLKYKGPFDHLPNVKKVAESNPDKFHTVVATDQRILPISADEGTGLVHTAVSAGSEDFKLGKKLGLPMIPVIADDASYLEGMGFLSGKNAKENPNIILDYLVDEDKKAGVDWVFLIENYAHRYPACWRCKTELVWKVTDEWYIAMDKPPKTDKKGETLRQKMIKVTKEIDWIPGFGLKRELDWLENMHDWLISKKNRYWGLCLPIWECEKCSNFEVIGSKDELRKKAVEGYERFEGHSPHKPYIDYVKIRCKSCGHLSSRIEPVGNPWLDAGVVPFSTISKNNSGSPLYTANKEEWKSWFPVDFITESFPGQFKNWFYSLIAMSTVFEETAPSKIIFGYATLLDETGRPMHKSWGNSIEFNEGASKMGVDVMRWMYARQNPSENLLFGFNVADEVRRQFHLKLWNVYNFFITYANLSGWSSPHQAEFASNNILDIWIVSRFSKLYKLVTKYFDNYDVYTATQYVEEFVNDFSNWYIRRSRDRVGQLSSEEERNQFFQTTHFVLTNLSIILAPVMPFMTDEIFTNLTNGESVHLTNWPKIDFKEDKELISEMDKLRTLVEKGHAIRKNLSIPVRQPLSKIYIPEKKLTRDLDFLIEDELNVKSVVWDKKGISEPEFDTILTPILIEEAKTRELIRKVQNERKKMGIGMTEKITIINSWFPEDKKLGEYLRVRTLADKLELGSFNVKAEK